MHVFGQVLGHALGQRRDQHAAAAWATTAAAFGIRSSTWLSVGRMMQTGSIRPVGRITCSTKTPPVRSSSQGPGVAETRRSAGAWTSHSSNFSGRLSMQDGRRKPYSARVDLRVVAAEHAVELRHGDMALVDDQQGVVGQVFEQGRRRLARIAPGQIARVVLDPGAGAGRLHHLQIEGGALLQPLAPPAACPCSRSSARRSFSSSLICLIGLLQRRPRRDVVAVGVDPDLVQRVGLLAGQRDRTRVIASTSSPNSEIRQARSS